MSSLKRMTGPAREIRAEQSCGLLRGCGQKLGRWRCYIDAVVVIRSLEAEDFRPIIGVVDEWWGRPIRRLLPRYLFDHFSNTSFIAEDHGEIVGFLVGFLSPARADEAYIHFAGVAPTWRGRGIARDLYSRFYELARADGRTEVRAITSPENRGSIEFHHRLGFELEPAPIVDGGVPVHADYGPDGEVRVAMKKRLQPRG